MNLKPAVDRSFSGPVAMIRRNLFYYFVFVLSVKPLPANTA
jgi:hypothetical protein